MKKRRSKVELLLISLFFNTIFIFIRHAIDGEAIVQEQNLHVQHPGGNFLHVRLHALLDVHAQVHRGAVQGVGGQSQLLHWQVLLYTNT